MFGIEWIADNILFCGSFLVGIMGFCCLCLWVYRSKVAFVGIVVSLLSLIVVIINFNGVYTFVALFVGVIGVMMVKRWWFPPYLDNPLDDIPPE